MATTAAPKRSMPCLRDCEPCARNPGRGKERLAIGVDLAYRPGPERPLQQAHGVRLAGSELCLVCRMSLRSRAFQLWCAGEPPSDAGNRRSRASGGDHRGFFTGPDFAPVFGAHAHNRAARFGGRRLHGLAGMLTEAGHMTHPESRQCQFGANSAEQRGAI